MRKTAAAIAAKTTHRGSGFSLLTKELAPTLEGGLPLFTELPSRKIPGNLESGLDLLLRPNPLLNPRPALSAGSPT
jgi:hypothetical protein